METAIFPHVNDQQIDAQTTQKLEIAKRLNSNKETAIKSHYPASPDRPQKLRFLSDGVTPTLVLGAVICSLYVGTLAVGDPFSIIFTTYLLSALIVSFGISYSNKSNEKKYNMEMQKYQHKQKYADNRLAQIRQELQVEIDKIQREGENEKKKYREEFEKNAQEMSVRFANSELVKEIIDWMMTGFSQLIDAADRSSHIQEINVPFGFIVCKDAVLCRLGEYDFQKKRCKPLVQPLEQAGLSRAIAAGLQLEIIMKYPKDISGTKVDIRMEQTYHLPESYTLEYDMPYNISDCPETTIVYTAVNGNYRSLREW